MADSSSYVPNTVGTFTELTKAPGQGPYRAQTWLQWYPDGAHLKRVLDRVSHPSECTIPCTYESYIGPNTYRRPRITLKLRNNMFSHGSEGWSRATVTRMNKEGTGWIWTGDVRGGLSFNPGSRFVRNVGPLSDYVDVGKLTTAFSQPGHIPDPDLPTIKLLKPDVDSMMFEEFLQESAYTCTRRQEEGLFPPGYMPKGTRIEMGTELEEADLVAWPEELRELDGNVPTVMTDDGRLATSKDFDMGDGPVTSWSMKNSVLEVTNSTGKNKRRAVGRDGPHLMACLAWEIPEVVQARISGESEIEV